MRIVQINQETVYKLDTKGKVRYVSIAVVDDTLIQESGVVGSEKPVTIRSKCIGKNIGKSNETTANQQALLEAKAKIKKKLEEGYYESIELAKSEEYISPMLAKDFKKEENKVIYPCFVQPKLDGMRCLKKQAVLTSRDNKVISTLKHIEKDLMMIQDIFDGELYAHGKSFQENMRLIKKYRKDQTEEIKYHVYDIVCQNLDFKTRHALLKTIVGVMKPENIVLVPTFEIKSKEELIAKHAEFLEQGYEGTMVRHGDAGYKVNARSSNLLKYKDFLDIACEIVDVEPNEKRPTQGRFLCKLPDGRTFGTGMSYTHEQREEVLTNKAKYIGKTAEIRFFEYTESGLPRFPVTVGIRLDK